VQKFERISLNPPDAKPDTPVRVAAASEVKRKIAAMFG
jgi:hypothetical protein